MLFSADDSSQPCSRGTIFTEGGHYSPVNNVRGDIFRGDTVHYDTVQWLSASTASDLYILLLSTVCENCLCQGGTEECQTKQLDMAQKMAYHRSTPKFQAYIFGEAL